MKKIFVSFLAILCVMSINAQKTTEDKLPELKHRDGLSDHHRMMKHREGIMKGHSGMMMKNIELTEAQKVQFKTEKENFRKQMEELKKNDNMMVKEWKSRMQQLQADHKTKIEGILTNDQKMQIEKHKAEMKAKHEKMENEKTEKMKARLGLSTDQSLKMDKAKAEMKSSLSAIKENKTLSNDLKIEQYRELKKQHMEKMKSILTEEQLKLLNEKKPQKKKVT